MSKNHVRKQQHELYFNEFELRALVPVCTRLGKDLGDFTRRELRYFLCIHYNLPHSERGDLNKVFAGLHLAMRTLRTIQRYEIGLHTNDPEVRKAIARMVNGNPDGATNEAVLGLQGMVNALLSFSERGH